MKKHKPNQLWLARKRRGLEQKQMAYLLGHSSVDSISRYENASRLPTLPLALELEIILGVPLRFIYRELYEQLSKEINEREEKDTVLKGLLGKPLGDGACSYRELLESPLCSRADLEKVRDHSTELSRRLAELWSKD